jgi:ketosteroid isomerase-like protein
VSEASLDLVRRWLEASNREDVQGFVELWDPQCEFFTLTGSRLSDAPYRGHAGVRRYREERTEVWAELRIEADELREVGDRAVVIGHLCGRGRGSGVEMDHALGLVFDFRGDRVLRVRSYPDPAQALEAATS